MAKVIGWALFVLVFSGPAGAQSLPTESLVIRLRADALQNQGLSNGDSVIEWLDIAASDSVSGTVAAVSGHNAPVFVTNILNGKSVVRFSNTNVLASAGFSWPDVNQGITLFAVCTGDQSGQTGERLCGIGQANGTPGQIMALDVSTSRSVADAGSGARFNNGKSLVSLQNPLDPGFHIAVLKIGQSDNYQDVCYYVDNSVLQVFDSTASPTNQVNFQAAGNMLTVGTSIINGAIATSDMFTGDLAELLVYNRQLSNIEIEQTIDYLAAEYGLGADAPGIDDMVIHLDASSLAGLNDGDMVSVWPDQVTDDAVIGTAAQLGSYALPTYKSSMLNGKAVVRFANSQVLSSADFTWPDVDAGLTVCAVLTGDSSGQPGERAFGIGHNTGSVGQIMAFDASTNTADADGGSGIRFNNGKSLVKNVNPIDNDFHTVILQMDQGWQYQSARYYVDDVAVETFDNSANGTNTLNLPSAGNKLTLGTSWINGSLGTSDMYSGDIAEIRVYNRLLATEEMEMLQDHLYDKYFYSLIAVSPRSLFLDEGQTAVLDVRLDAAPAKDVVVSLADCAELNQLTIVPSEILFTPVHWNDIVSVQVSAEDDDWYEGPHSAVLSISAQSEDAQYQDITTSVPVAITDNECSSINSPAEDLNFDCIVNLADMALLVESWLWCDPMKDLLCDDVR